MATVQRAFNTVEVALAEGDLVLARRFADEAVSVGTGWHLVAAQLARARVAIAEGNREEAQCDAHDALACVVSCGAYQPVAGILECLADLARDADSQQAARLFGAADALRQRTGIVRFKVHQAGLRGVSWGAARGHGRERHLTPPGPRVRRCPPRRRSPTRSVVAANANDPTSGWASLTPAERDVVRLVCEGLANKDIATRLFVSPRTVQAHLTHVYTKLGLSSRVQLVQEAARRA